MLPRTQRKTLALGLCLGLATSGILAAGDVASSAEEVNPILVGQQVPAVSLKAADGSTIDLQAAAQKQPTILIFYRGGW